MLFVNSVRIYINLINVSTYIDCFISHNFAAIHICEDMKHMYATEASGHSWRKQSDEYQQESYSYLNHRLAYNNLGHVAATTHTTTIVTSNEHSLRTS